MSEILEQPESADGGSNILGKFADVSELAKAYESLQSEFTRKSQMLAQLQKNEGQAGAAIEQPPVIVPDAVPINREEIIKEYLTSIANSQIAPTVITTASDLAFGIKPEPLALNDAKRVAENFFKTKEIIK